jgi:hypothetical protein
MRGVKDLPQEDRAIGRSGGPPKASAAKTLC